MSACRSLRSLGDRMFGRARSLIVLSASDEQLLKIVLGQHGTALSLLRSGTDSSFD